jgi:Raf kinase inhibitor-like YbhB/YbcL family protein
MGDFKLTSSAFEDGGEIPRECGYKNGNEEPPLTISGTPEGTKSLALIMDDPDAMGAVGKVWVHWVIWNITPKDEIISGQHGFMGLLGMTDFGEVGYGGPAPPDKKHTYVFKLYALDDELDRLTGKDGNDDVTKADVEKAMEGHIVEQTQLTGTYAP